MAAKATNHGEENGRPHQVLNTGPVSRPAATNLVAEVEVTALMAEVMDIIGEGVDVNVNKVSFNSDIS